MASVKKIEDRLPNKSSYHNEELLKKLHPLLRKQLQGNFDDYTLMYVVNADTDGLGGITFHNQSALNVKRGTPQLCNISVGGTRSIHLSTPPEADAQTWGRQSRGGLVIPDNAVGAVYGCMFTYKAWKKAAVYRLVFGLDTELEGDDRVWHKISLLVSDNGTDADDKWQFSSAGGNTPSWSDLETADGAIVDQAVPYNEPYKTMVATMMVYVNFNTNKIETLWVNSKRYDIASDSGNITAGTADALGDLFLRGLVPMHYIINRSSSAPQCDMYYNYPFLAYVHKNNG